MSTPTFKYRLLTLRNGNGKTKFEVRYQTRLFGWKQLVIRSVMDWHATYDWSTRDEAMTAITTGK